MSGLFFTLTGKLQTLITRLNATRAAYLDNLAAYTTARGAKLDFLDLAISGARRSWRLIETQTTQIWTVPAGVYGAIVTVVGGGGGGAGGAAVYNPSPYPGGGGGGAGGIVWRRPVNLSPGSNVTITVGDGGPGGGCGFWRRRRKPNW